MPVTKEDAIVAAAIKCIEKYGIEKTTIRRIGMEAGVNSAAVSYYFRSKEALIRRAMDLALHNAFDFENFSDSKELPVKERLARIMEGMLEGAQRFPNLTKAFFTELLLKNDYASQVVQKCGEFLSGIESELAAEYERMEKTDLRIALMQLSSATFLFFGLFPGFFTGYPEIDLTDRDIRRAYVESLVEKLF